MYRRPGPSAVGPATSDLRLLHDPGDFQSLRLKIPGIMRNGARLIGPALD
jgi:hypothetical protein